MTDQLWTTDSLGFEYEALYTLYDALKEKHRLDDFKTAETLVADWPLPPVETRGLNEIIDQSVCFSHVLSLL